MGTFSHGMSDAEIERARNHPDKTVVTPEENGDQVAECPRCGHQGHVVIYYPALSDRSFKCMNCHQPH